jgi:hypothetical protein
MLYGPNTNRGGNHRLRARSGCVPSGRRRRTPGQVRWSARSATATSARRRAGSSRSGRIPNRTTSARRERSRKWWRAVLN